MNKDPVANENKGHVPGRGISYADDVEDWGGRGRVPRVTTHRQRARSSRSRDSMSIRKHIDPSDRTRRRLNPSQVQHDEASTLQ